MEYQRPNRAVYGLAQAASWLVAKAVFRRQILRNEIRGVDGAYVVIANHQCKLDFVNLIGTCRRPMSFVISKAFYRTLPIGGLMQKMGVIPKQQFQTTVADMKKMKAVVDNGQPLVIYPAGLMCEDGLSTPIPGATYKFLKWLNVDVYVARSYGTYFAMPKWAKDMRPGRTYLDIYKLFSKEELRTLPVEAVRERTEQALLFDAYREQEQYRQPYSDDIRGLENVLYLCPHCHREYTMQVQSNNRICCTACGYEQVSDKLGFFHNEKGLGPEIRYASDWSSHILRDIRSRLGQDPAMTLQVNTQIQMVDEKKHKYCPVGQGVLSLKEGVFSFRGELHGQQVEISLPVVNIPTLPFTPGKHLEIQQGDITYRCVPEDGRVVMKFIHMVKSFYEMNQCRV